jgi:hypothetical protein
MIQSNWVLIQTDEPPTIWHENFDPFGEEVQPGQWYWAEQVWFADLPFSDEVFYAIRSGPVSPLTFERKAVRL